MESSPEPGSWKAGVSKSLVAGAIGLPRQRVLDYRATRGRHGREVGLYDNGPRILRTLDLRLWHGTPEPLLEPRQAEAGVVAGGEAPVVHLDAVVTRVGVCNHRPGVAGCGQIPPGEF